MKLIKRPLFWLVVILLVASFLRLWKLGTVPVSLFGDELDVGYQAYSILKTGRDYYGNFLPLHFHSLAEYRTPLFLYSAVPTVAVFGISAWGVRLPAAIFGILGVWAMYLLIKELIREREEKVREGIALLSAAVLAFSPWHIQYSRAAFEVTQLLFLLLIGLYFFFRGIRSGKYLWVSALCFVLTPWVYSTAKLFTPILLLFLLLVWRKEIFSLPKKYLLWAVITLAVIGAPVAYSTLFGGGAQRYGYVSVFSDPTTEPEVGTARFVDARARGEKGTGLNPTLVDRAIHNKFTFWGKNVIWNYLQPFSSDFLFNRGDPNLRHSLEGMGMFFKVEAVALIVGLALYFTDKGQDRKLKMLIGFWILAGVIPAAITRDGGNHATRLILILPPLVFLIAYGIIAGLNLFKGKTRILVGLLYLGMFMACFFFYQHNYWVHNPTYSERWWHTGYGEAIKTIKSIQGDYDKVVISTANEPPWVFFAGWYEYPPGDWQKNFPTEHKKMLENVGEVSYIDKFYFGSYGGNMYDWGKLFNKKTLYLAVAKEVGVNLILEPQRTPGDLNLLKTIAYPSGEPAFYLFTGR